MTDFTVLTRVLGSYGVVTNQFREVRFSPVPEPSTALLLGIGLAAMAGCRRQSLPTGSLLRIG